MAHGSQTNTKHDKTAHQSAKSPKSAGTVTRQIIGACGYVKVPGTQKRISTGGFLGRTRIERAKCFGDTSSRQNARPARFSHALVGTGIKVFRKSPEKVDDLFSVSLLRGSVLIAPGAPTDTTVNVATRTVATTALPANATRLEVYRQAPGGAPELLVIGDPGQLSITIPNLFIFTPGVTYQIWLQARNSRGTSDPGPMQEWLGE